MELDFNATMFWWIEIQANICCSITLNIKSKLGSKEMIIAELFVFLNGHFH